MTTKKITMRDPFPPEAIGKLPRPLPSAGEKTDCSICGTYHAFPAVHLDYVGHAELTERLLDVDPDWNWEPVSFDEGGFPRRSFTDTEATMWIRLTVLGVTRIGVGSVKLSKWTTEVDKQLISDALRNAAMRFGAALDLWKKSDTEVMWNGGEPSTTDHPDGPKTKPQRPTKPEEKRDHLECKVCGKMTNGARVFAAKYPGLKPGNAYLEGTEVYKCGHCLNYVPTEKPVGVNGPPSIEEPPPLEDDDLPF